MGNRVFTTSASTDPRLREPGDPRDSKGSVRIVDDPSGCTSAEDLISWERSARASRRWFSDRDLDGYGDWYDAMDSPVQPAGFVGNNGDCNDDSADVNPGTGKHDGVGWDFDCNGLANEAGIWWYPDSDGDGWGRFDARFQGSTDGKPPVPGAIRRAGDCNDADAQVTTHCRDSAYWYQWSEDQRMFVLRGGDEDEDGHVRAEPFEGNIMGDDCDDYEPNVYPGNTEIPYDGLDNDCTPATLDTEADVADVGRHDPVGWGIRTP